MAKIRELFDKSKPIDRRIEKVITYETPSDQLLKHEIQEYVATESIEDHLNTLLGRLEEGMGGATEIPEIGVWVSGFYGCGKSSFTKYLGFALDPTRSIEGRPFVEWLQDQFTSQALRSRLGTVAKKYPAAVIMLDLASEQLAGATMAEISTVLYHKVMQWAGYARDEKIAYLEFMLERDGHLDDFKRRISELANGKTWDEVKDQPLVTKALASKAAVEFYPSIFPDTKTFNEIRIEDRIKEDERIAQMLDLIKRKTGKQNIIIILDEVGQYVAARDDLILNLDGMAKNIKTLGRGHSWVIATAQQTLTEDDPRAAAKLFKLKDRFPVSIDLEASDIKEICFKRLLGKSPSGDNDLKQLYDRYGPQLRHATELSGARAYKGELDRDSFARFYPFLPHHFEILLQLLRRLAKTRGGIGLRSAIKVIQDVLVDHGKTHTHGTLLADQQMGALANTELFYDTLRADIERPFAHAVRGVEKTEQVFGKDSIHAKVSKSVAVLQILEDFPVTRENIAALMHPSVDSPPLTDAVNSAVGEMLDEESVPLNEVDGTLRFMSEAVVDLENERRTIVIRAADMRSIQNNALREMFTPAPTARISGTRMVGTGFRVYAGTMPASLAGEKEFIQTNIEFLSASEYGGKKNERVIESQQRPNANTIYFLGHRDEGIDDVLAEIFQCREIYKIHRNKATEKEVDEYLRSQLQRAESLEGEVSRRLKKALAAGSLVFRGRPRGATELDSGGDVAAALKKYLEDAAGEVYDKYAEAPVQCETGIAERLLKTDKLNKIASKDDPLSLVKKSGSSVIDTNHAAVISVKDYLERNGQVEGRRLMDDFFAPRYGWSKDTTRYVVAAMLAGGMLRLRIAGQDVTVRGEVATEALKSTNNFNKINVALRDAAPDPQAMIRARDRLLTLTGEEPLPLEEEISKCVARHFPDLQKAYAPLADKLEGFGLQGDDRALHVQEGLAEILKGDASDASARLGGQQCPLFDDLVWAKEIKKAFDNGIGEVVKKAGQLLKDIPALPNSGILGSLNADTQTQRKTLEEYLGSEEFYKYATEMKKQIGDIESRVQTAAGLFSEEQIRKLEAGKARIQNMPEWAQIGTEDKGRLGGDLDAITIEPAADLKGIQRLLHGWYPISMELERIEKEMRSLAEQTGADESVEEEQDTSTPATVTMAIPKIISSPGELDALIRSLESYKERLNEGAKLIIKWM